MPVPAATDGSLLVAYIPPAHKGNITVDMRALSGKAYANWFDPTDGTYTEISGSRFDNKAVVTFTPPGKNTGNETDWVLILSTKAR